MEKLYETGISPDKTYIYARKFHKPYKSEIAQMLAKEFVILGENLDILGCLVDIRGTTSVSSEVDKYKSAYNETTDIGLPQRWKYAFIKDHGDDSLAFIETVMNNAGYMFQVFEDEQEAVNWLQEVTPKSKKRKFLPKILSYHLRSQDLELQFRKENHLQDKRQYKMTMLIALFSLTLFLILEFISFRQESTFQLIITNRISAIILVVLSFWIIKLNRTILAFDRIVFAISMIIVFHLVFVNYTKTFDMTIVVIWDILTIFVIYTAVPIGLRYQIICTLFLSIFNVGICLLDISTVWSLFEIVAIISAYIIANIYGLYLSLRRKRLRRHEFILFKKEEKAKQDIETAFAELKVLRGFIPICASCKKIRDDKGYWNQVEAYIESRTEAQFSHALCEECSDKLYGNQEWYKKSKLRKKKKT